MPTAPTSQPHAREQASASVDDAHLVARAQADPRAFAPLYTRSVDLVYRYCYRRLGHPEAAADATAQIFAKALAALPRYRTDAPSFRSWLFTIAHNVITDDLRARRPAAPLAAAEHLSATGPSPEDEVLRREAGSTVLALLAGLPPDQRQILELRLAGLSGPEIAATLGRSLGSVKIAQVRAFARLRTALDPASATTQEADA
ncbi:MAG: sigma-70 family RNA polymerase sigma factor [Thermomicrobiales bacterium]|nr:sigma-70 family RNA polymerase sigma factor [Thermomicrobiales bacterium]